MRSRFSLLLLALGATTLCAAAGIEFIGVLASENTTKFAFRDPATQASRWIGLGESFGSYQLTTYDAKEETAVLMQDGALFRVKLVTAKVRDSNANPPLTFAQARAIYLNLRKLFAWADQYYLQTGKTSATLDEMVASKIALPIKPVAGEDYTTLKFDQNSPFFSVKTAGGETITLDELHDGSANLSTFYELKAGDTGAKIARAKSLTLGDLAALNPEIDFARLAVGQPVRVR